MSSLSSQSVIPRKVLKVRPSISTFEGGGFPVYRPFPTNSMKYLDPFILLDEMGPINYPPGKAKGAPDHPHRGFETVTYMIQGQMEHKDSRGNSGKLGPGDVQWMTAGRGVVHSEMPPAELIKTGGLFHGLQLWVNLPQKDKMILPRYQEYSSEQLPQVTSSDGKVWVKIITGTATSFGKTGIIDTHSPMLYLHVKNEPGSIFQQEVPADFNVFAYVLNGVGKFGDLKLNNVQGSAHELVQFETTEGYVLVTNDSNEALEYLLIGGAPLNEPIVQRGPFVMNTAKEIEEAWGDFYSGKMGSIDF